MSTSHDPHLHKFSRVVCIMLYSEELEYSTTAFGNFFEFYWLFSLNSKFEPVSKELILVIFTIFNYFTKKITGF